METLGPFIRVYRDYIGFIWGCMGLMEKNMETLGPLIRGLSGSSSRRWRFKLSGKSLPKKLRLRALRMKGQGSESTHTASRREPNRRFKL